MEIVPWTYNNPRVDRSKLEKQEILFQGHLLEILQDTDKEIDANKNTAFKLWDGAFLLARHLEDTDYFGSDFWRGKRCVELGAGCGLVGQVAWLLGADVTLTDLEEALPHTHKCVKVNVDKVKVNQSKVKEDKFKVTEDQIHTQVYSWGEGVNKFTVPFDVILGSDVIYQPKLAKVFVRALEELSGPDTKILISYKPRGLGEHVTFDLLARRGFTVTAIDKCDHPQEFRDSDYDILHIATRKSDN